ncbi:MAG: hypothetical protein PHH84_03050 [Oscillospiraceae bacterium]|nr:hypothetical protein [Oscillospiraceae bacterium]
MCNVVYPAGGQNGYVDIPFESFKNKQEEPIAVGDALNFIAFKYSDSTMRESDTYFADLQLYRQKGSDSGSKSPGTGESSTSTLFIILFGAFIVGTGSYIYERKVNKRRRADK